jgi:hypothetical protein
MKWMGFGTHTRARRTDKSERDVACCAALAASRPPITSSTMIQNPRIHWRPWQPDPVGWPGARWAMLPGRWPQ